MSFSSNDRRCIYFSYFILRIRKKIIKYWLYYAVKYDLMKEAFIIGARKQRNEDPSMYVFFLSRWLKCFKRDIWRKNRQTNVCRHAYINVDSSKQWEILFFSFNGNLEIFLLEKKITTIFAEQGMFQSIVAYIVSTQRERRQEKDTGREIEKERERDIRGVWG